MKIFAIKIGEKNLITCLKHYIFEMITMKKRIVSIIFMIIFIVSITTAFSTLSEITQIDDSLELQDYVLL